LSEAGDVRFFKSGAHTYVEVNTDFAAGADLQIDLVGAMNLSAGDFIL
jgi:hypothetical protein